MPYTVTKSGSPTLQTLRTYEANHASPTKNRDAPMPMKSTKAAPVTTSDPDRTPGCCISFLGTEK
jgi:hypothetical protein